jgi:hypothetical protein
MTKPLNLLLPFDPGQIGKKGRDKIEQSLFDRGSINNSRLTDIARLMRGEQLFTGQESYLAVGTEIHKRALEPWKKPTHMGMYEPIVVGCVRALENTMAFKVHRALAGRKGVERFVHGLVFDQLMHGTIDLCGVFHGGRHGGDIKTTSTTSYTEFIHCMQKYGYWRQALVYMLLDNLDTFVFYAVQKKSPFNVFVVDVSRFPKQMKQAEEELKFLLYFYKTYGIPK